MRPANAKELLMSDLKLVALDAEDLAIVSTHLQDACLQVGDMAYLAKQMRFAAIANRFDWEAAVKDGGAPGTDGFVRRRAALRFERVLGAKLTGIDLARKSDVVCLLAIQFEESEPPGGFVTLIFAGNSAVRLNVECIEAELTDLGAAWQARGKPEHRDEGPTGRSS